MWSFKDEMIKQSRNGNIAKRGKLIEIVTMAKNIRGVDLFDHVFLLIDVPL